MDSIQQILPYLVNLRRYKRLFRQDARNGLAFNDSTTMMTAEKVKFQLEIPLNSSKGVLYNCIKHAFGLGRVVL